MKYNSTPYTKIEKNEDNTYTVYRAEYIKDCFLTDRRHTILWGVKKEDGTVLIDPDYFTENEERDVKWALLDDGYETYENIASIPNWWVVRESR